MSDIEFSGVRKRFGQHEVIKGIDLKLDAGAFTVFVGPSGCGKTTVLRLIAGLEEISGGSISIGGRVINDLKPAERRIAMVFQSYALYPHMSVFENMAFGLRQARTPPDEIRRRVTAAAQSLRIEELLNRRPRQLSGGQRQRVAIGRAIVREPQVFLFDEPLSNLDAALRGRMRVELNDLHRRIGNSMVYVTHDQIEAMTLADTIVVFNAGRIEQVGTPRELYTKPANIFVAQFIGSPVMNVLPALAVAVDGSTARLRFPDGQEVAIHQPASGVMSGGSISVGVRPEHIGVDDDGALKATVGHLEYLGEILLVHASGLGGEIVAKAPADRCIQVGETLSFRLSPKALHLFDTDGKRLE